MSTLLAVSQQKGHKPLRNTFSGKIHCIRIHLLTFYFFLSNFLITKYTEDRKTHDRGPLEVLSR